MDDTDNELATLRSDNERLGRERDEATGYTRRLLIALMERHYPDRSPNWAPLPDLFGMLTQIDNLTTGLTRAQAAEAERDTLLAQVEKMRGVLTEIAESDDIDNALDPERNKRLARAALTKEPS